MESGVPVHRFYRGKKADAETWIQDQTGSDCMECDERIYRIMACGTGKTEEKRKIHLKLRIMVIQVVKGIAEKVLIQVGIPAEGCIWVRVMAEAVRMRNA